MKGAIFDLDGTLLDSMGFWEHFGSDYLRSLGKIPPKDFDTVLKTMSLADAARLLQKEYGITATVSEILQDIDLRTDEFYRNRVQLKKGARELLQKLHQKGVTLCVATASNRTPAELALKRNGVLSLFSFLLTCSEEGVNKNSPDIYQRALEKLKTPKEETVVFEDAPHAYQTAKQAGFPVIGVYDSYFGEEGFVRMEELCDWDFDHCRL